MPGNNPSFVTWFRSASPYIHAHRSKTFVISFGGETVVKNNFPNLISDIALLHALGISIVIVHGARPQIEAKLKAQGQVLHYVGGLRITDSDAIICVKEAAGLVRIEIESLLSMGLANSPMAGAKIPVASGNFVIAKPLGIHNGIDYQHTGVVRRVDKAAVKQRLHAGAIVLISPLGYSPTGEVFNLSSQDLAAECAIALAADKLIDVLEIPLPLDTNGNTANSLTPNEVTAILNSPQVSELIKPHLQAGLKACQNLVPRVHLIDNRQDGAILTELFTIDGTGTLITANPYEITRTATIEDIGGILELLKPLEQQNILIRRSRELLETEIERFTVMERDNTIVGCVALYPYPETNWAELACLAVHGAYQRQGRGTVLLAIAANQALNLGISRIFALTTQTSHWFLEHGFVTSSIDNLPTQRKKIYNPQRNSKLFIKSLKPK
ncbi:N-acetylglutamate synthase [Achromatium sp. WMS2]|nr:N-acetylglutamate synthase [Achromatium sp. WMS2]